VNATVTLDHMPDHFSMAWLELNHREVNVRCLTGPVGSMVQRVMPELRKTETRLYLALLVKLS
jgi:hypothetical protein